MSRPTCLTLEYLSTIMSEARLRYRVPAITVTVMNSNTFLLQEIQGTRVVDDHEQATLDDYFHIGSCSKSVLAMMAGKLIEQQKLTWHTKFFAVFPQLKDAANGAYRDITLEDLFLCEAGIKAYTDAAAEPLPDYGPEVSDPRLEFACAATRIQKKAERKISTPVLQRGLYAGVRDA